MARSIILEIRIYCPCMSLFLLYLLWSFFLDEFAQISRLDRITVAYVDIKRSTYLKMTTKHFNPI